MNKNRITINGVTVEVEGGNVSVRNGTIFVDDQPVQSGLSGQVHLYWHGELAHLDANGPVTCYGNIYGEVEANGPVTCYGQAHRAIEANGPVTCHGHSGSVNASRVVGSINANGPVNFR